MILGLTGHRPKTIGGFNIPNPTYNYIIEQIRYNFLKLKPDKIISGMALGVDVWSVEIAIDLNIPFIAAIPFKGQEQKWPMSSQNHYRSLLTKAEQIVEVCEPPYAAYKMNIRNEWIVDHCDSLLAVFNGTPGGTKNCIDYAKNNNKEIIVINP